jgi:20S proteasome subunit beta 7
MSYALLAVCSTKERAQSTTDAHPALAPEQIYEYLSNVMYARRSKMNPLWNAIVLGGVKDGKRWGACGLDTSGWRRGGIVLLTFRTWTCSLASFLGYVDLLGTTYQAPTLATGFASHFAQPLLREAYEEREAAGKRGEKEGLLLSRQEAEAVLDNCMKVLFYRDARSLNKVGHGYLLR